MTEPLSIFTAPPRSEQTATISADLLEAYVELERAAYCQCVNECDASILNLYVAYNRVRELSGRRAVKE